MRYLSKRLTYANVMSSIAVFLVLGGAAFAASQLPKNSVGAKQLKKNAVTTAKIKMNAVTGDKVKNDALTGDKIVESSLGEVPSATHSTTADSADTIGGLRVVKFSLNGASPIANTQILELNGLKLSASCAGGTVDLTAQTSVDNGEISAWASDASSKNQEGEYEDEFKTGETFELPAPTHSDVIGDGAYTGGDLKTVRFFYNEEDSIGTNDCLLNGYAIG